MSNQINEIENRKNTDEKEPVGGFERAMEFCRKNLLYIAVAGLFVVLVIILVRFTGGDGSPDKQKMVPATEIAEVPTETQPEESFEKDAYPQINELFDKYYKAYANGNTKKLAKLAEPMSDVEKSYISKLSEYVKKYKNMSCYTKKGLDDNSFIVSVSLEIKFKNIKTTAPGLETFYVRKRDDGSYYIDNLYGQFNSKMNEIVGQNENSEGEAVASAGSFEADENVSALIEEFNQQEDVVALQTEIQQKYEAALASDEDLKTLIENTIPDAYTVWASDQVAAAKKAEEDKKAAEEAEKKAAEEEAAKKAEEEKKAAEEAAKKAAEEEAAKKAEEEKKAAEQAASVIVYATDKVNVRAEASETADILGQLEVGSKTTRLEEKDGWSRIDYSGGTQGYVKSEYLSTEAPAALETPADEAPAQSSGALTEGAVITIKESVNIRKSMGEDAEKIATAFAGEKVTVIMSYAEGWTKVTYGDKTGFIKTELLQ